MYDDDDFFEEDEDVEEDAFFPDEDKEEIEERSRPSFDEVLSDRSSFLDDPWPITAFILTVIGFGFTLLTPVEIWNANHYYLIVTYLLLVFVAAASVISLNVWKQAAGSRLRFGGLTNLLVVLICGAFGLIDTILVVTTGYPILPDTNTPVLALAFVIVLFSMYSLWLIQRTFNADPTTK